MLKIGEQNKEREDATKYLQEAKQLSDQFTQKTIKALPDKIGKQDLSDALKENWF